MYTFIDAGGKDDLTTFVAIVSRFDKSRCARQKLNRILRVRGQSVKLVLLVRSYAILYLMCGRGRSDILGTFDVCQIL